MKLLRVAQELWCKPWCIVPAMHRQICQIISQHITGNAHLAGGCAAEFPAPAPGADTDSMYDVTTDGIATIQLDGVIGRKLSAFEQMSGATDLNDFSAALNVAANDSNVRSILLSIDSPGGTVGGVPEAAQMVKAASKKKPMAAFVDGSCCSAAYWIASQAPSIFSTQSGEIGSIGVYSAFLDETRNFEKEGFKMEVFSTGAFKGMGMPGTSLTEAQREEIQAGVDQVFDWFSRAVLVTRPALSKEHMQGQTWFADDAQKEGLIDYVGGIEDAMDELRSGMEKT